MGKGLSINKLLLQILDKFFCKNKIEVEGKQGKKSISSFFFSANY
jgi:hypothetical protein